jgi:osmotically-inducible protein OsmY
MKSTKYAIKSNDEINMAVKDALLFDPRVLYFNPIVTVSDGGVVLTGTVDNLKAKRAAEQDARNTVGVWRVQNLLRVRAKIQSPNDKLARNVKDTLLRDPFMDRYQIHVDALDGTVYLAGAVDSYYEKTHAEDIASKVAGVAVVNNNLTVSFPAYAYYTWPYDEDFDAPYYNRPLTYSGLRYTSDAAMKATIENELFWSPFVGSEVVHVAVNNGVATLTGTVDNWREYETVAANAWEGGAHDVINNLKVKGIDL